MSTSKISVDVNAETNPEDKLFQEKLLKLQERIQKIQEKKEIIEQAESLPDVKRAAAFVKNYIEGNKEHNDQQPLDKIMIVFNNKDAREKFIKKHNLYKEEAGDTASDNLPYVKVPPSQFRAIYQNLQQEKIEEKLFQEKLLKLQERIQKIQEKKEIIEQAESLPDVKRAAAFVKNYIEGNKEHNDQQPLDKIMIVFSNKDAREKFIKKHNLYKEEAGDTASDDLPYVKVPPDQIKLIYQNLISEKEERIRQAKCIKNFPGVDSARPHVHNHNWKNEELNRKQPLEKIVICFSSTKHRDEFIKRTSLPKHYMEQHSRLLEVTPDDVKVIYEKWHEIRKQQLADQQKFKENLLEEKQKQTSSQNSHSSDKYIISASEEMKGTIHLSSEKLTSQQKFKEVLAAQKKNQGLISDPTKLLDEFMKEFKKSLEKSKILGITPPSQLMEKYNRAEKYNLTFTIDDVLAHIKSREGKSCRSKEVLGNIIGKEKLESLIKKPEGKLENSMKDESKRSICF